MSIVPKESIQVIAQSIGVHNLSPEVLPSLAADVEYRLREIIQESIKCMRHSKTTFLTAHHVDTALTLKTLEPIYGFAAGEPLRFKRAVKHKDLFYINDKDLEFKDVIEAPLSRSPLDTGIAFHWLAIEGVQPAIPENVALDALAVSSDSAKQEYKEDGISADVKYPVKNVLSREHQLYFEKITELTLNRFETSIFKQALLSLTRDLCLHPLVPYFTYFVSDEVAKNLNNLPFLVALMRLVWSLVHNPNLFIEPYLHQLMPPVITCIIAKQLGNRSSDNHWKLRNLAADLAASICKRYGHVYHNLQPRVTRTLLHAFLDPRKSLPQQFGAIQGLAALGPNVVQMLVLPNIEPYLKFVEPDLHLEKQKNEMKRHEARRVYTALLCAAGECINHHLKMLPTRLAAKKTTVRAPITTTMPNKRKASMDNIMMMMQQQQQQQQPPLKRLASEGSMHSLGMQAGYSPNIGISDVGFSSMSRQLQNENVPGGSGGRRDKAIVGIGQPQRISALDTGEVVSSITQYFGESLLSFVPLHELSMFL